MKLTHTQAYLLGSIAKHSEHYRRNMTTLKKSIERDESLSPRSGIHIDAANKAYFASQLVEELLDQAYEMFENISSEELAQLTGISMTPSASGFRRRYNEGDEY